MDISPIFGIRAEKSAAFCIIGMRGSGNNHWDFSFYRPSVTGFMHSISHKHKNKKSGSDVFQNVCCGQEEHSNAPQQGAMRFHTRPPCSLNSEGREDAGTPAFTAS